MGAAFSEETAASTFPKTGKPMTVRVQCSHDGQRVDLTECYSCRVTSDWTAADLREAIEQKAGVHRQCQTLIFAGKKMDTKCTLQEIMCCKVEQMPARVTLFLNVKMDIFPQRLGPFAMVRAPFEAEDFLIPQLTKDIRAGFYWEMKTGILESHGLRARTSRITGQVSPLHSVQCDAACHEGACVPPEAEDFAWSYPVVDWERVESDAYALEDWDSLEASAAMKSFLTVGGFIYFDAAGRIVGTTTPGKSRGGDGDGLHFGAPQRWRHEWTLPLAEQGRFQPVTMRQIVGVGARSFCWLRPDEVIEDGDGQPLPVQPQVPHGGLVYLFREDVMAGEEWDRALDRYFPVAAACDEGCATLVPAASDGNTLSLFRAFSLVEECPNADPEWAGAGPEPFAEETDQDFDCEIPEECEVPRELSTPALHHRCPEFHASLVRARQASLAVERQRSGEAFEAP